MASCKTTQWATAAPYVKLTVTKGTETGSSVVLEWELQYIASSAAQTNSARDYTVKIDGDTVKSGSYDINGKTGTKTIASGTKTISKSTSGAKDISFSVSFDFKLTWGGSYKGTLTASDSIEVAKKTSYTVKYDANGGTGAPSSQTKWYGTTLTLSSAKPTRTGYSFQGWATSASGSVAYAAGASYTSNAAVTLYAIWKANTYSVKYNANGGSIGNVTDQTKTYGVTLKLDTDKPTRTGYTFKGWATSASGSVAYAAGASYTANAAVTLYAVWQVITYTVTYNPNGGTGAPSSQTKTYGKTLTLSTQKPTKTNYTFKGWATSSTAAAAGTVTYTAGGSYTTNSGVTLYAVWELAYTKPKITNYSVARYDEATSKKTNDGKSILVTFTWSTFLDVSSILIEWWNVSTPATVSKKTITASGKNGNVSAAIGSSALKEDTVYAVKVTVADSNGSTLITKNVAAGMVLKALKNGAGLSLPGHLYIGDKNAYHDGKTGVYFSKDGYMHLQRSSAEGYHPYIGFYVDDATEAGAQIRLNGSTKQLEFASAAGYKFWNSIFTTSNFYVGNKTSYQDGKTGVMLHGAGYIHIQRDTSDGVPYINFYLNTEETPSGQIYLNKDTRYLQFAYANGYRFNANVYLNANLRFDPDADGKQTHYIGAQWADGAHHYIIERVDDGLTTALGWAGSSTYKTITKIRGQTCQYQNSSGVTTLSDERLKKDFTALDKWSAFFNALEPCAFKMKAGTSGRYHLGFKAQQVEKALAESGLTTQDFAGFIKMPYKVDNDDPERSAVYEAAGIKEGDDEYGLIYSEFTALNTYKIQQLQKEVDTLKNEVAELKAMLKEALKG